MRPHLEEAIPTLKASTSQSCYCYLQVFRPILERALRSLLTAEASKGLGAKKRADILQQLAALLSERALKDTSAAASSRDALSNEEVEEQVEEEDEEQVEEEDEDEDEF